MNSIAPRVLVAAIVWVGLLAGCQTGPRFEPPRGLATHGVALVTSPVQATNLPPALLQPPTDLFVLGPGDLIEVEILGEPDSSETALVCPDGKIYYSFLPGMDIWGLTLRETKGRLETELKNLRRDEPRVAVTLRAVGSKNVWLLGRLAKPGVYPMTNPLTLLEAISLAGGVLTPTVAAQDLVDLRRSFILRQGQALPVDLERLLRQGDLAQNAYLQADDLIYVKSAEGRDVYVLGTVGRPGVVPFKEGLTLANAVAMAGGPAKDAYRSHVAIVRGALSQPEIAVVDYQGIVTGKALDVPLAPSDIVYVPASPYRTLNNYAEMIVGSFVRTVAVNEGARAVLGARAAPVGVTMPTYVPITP